ncbi:Dihydrosphingosine 1-phosphate phosphatase LCB3 [Nakaseomyces bracarensis]|uniref:Dihydrosphingosine 1-phosphate phosphatase LCB3 n=1 Tax=Nakaseomyces bracarensis TaxID=273131 RepID=A0ABR4NVX5_9SACH
MKSVDELRETMTTIAPTTTTTTTNGLNDKSRLAPPKVRKRALSDPNDYQEKNVLSDPGNHPNDHYKPYMSPLRFKVRSYLRRFVDKQSPVLYSWQSSCRCKALDIYFTYTSLMGSHTFYVLFLPLPVYFGYFEFTRDMVYILGYSIYLSGFLKDYCCLPRPTSPPLHRITLSEYTTKEYGAPSSHTANATGVSLLFLTALVGNPDYSPLAKCALFGVVIFYYWTLVLGRIYCGMHGLLDLVSGSLVGVFCFAIRAGFRMLLKNWEYGEHWWFPALSVIWGLSTLFTHITPVDECPCFADSVAFMGVVSGLEVSDWFIRYFFNDKTFVYAFTTDYSYTQLLSRLGFGVLLVVLWKYVISKPLVYNFFLLKMCRVRDDRALKERLILQQIARNGNECIKHVGVADIDILGRFIIYAGIPVSVMLFSPLILYLQ